MAMLKFNWMRCSISLFGVSDNVVAMLLERYALVSRRNSVDIAATANPDRILPRRDDSVISEGARRYIIMVNKVKCAAKYECSVYESVCCVC